jgi:hypothetical protein
LLVQWNTYALVVSMEILSLNGYWGNNRSMLMCQAYGIDTLKVAPADFTYSQGESVVSDVKTFQSL